VLPFVSPAGPWNAAPRYSSAFFYSSLRNLIPPSEMQCAPVDRENPGTCGLQPMVLAPPRHSLPQLDFPPPPFCSFPAILPFRSNFMHRAVPICSFSVAWILHPLQRRNPSFPPEQMPLPPSSKGGLLCPSASRSTYSRQQSDNRSFRKCCIPYPGSAICSRALYAVYSGEHSRERQLFFTAIFKRGNGHRPPFPCLNTVVFSFFLIVFFLCGAE